MTRGQRLAVGVAAGLLVVALVVAGWWLWPRTGPAPTAEPTPSPASVDPSRVSPTELPEVPDLSDGTGAIADASFGPCGVTAGEQRVTGTVTNSTTEAVRYVVTVSWVNGTSDVLARGVAQLKNVAPGAEKEFKVAAQVPDGVTTCTFHVLRGAS